MCISYENFPWPNFLSYLTAYRMSHLTQSECTLLFLGSWFSSHFRLFLLEKLKSKLGIRLLWDYNVIYIVLMIVTIWIIYFITVDIVYLKNFVFLIGPIFVHRKFDLSPGFLIQFIAACGCRMYLFYKARWVTVTMLPMSSGGTNIWKS